MLAVIEHEQRAALVQMSNQHVERQPTRHLGHTDGRDHRRRQQPSILQAGQFNPPHPVGMVVDRVGSRLQRQARLAATTRARERQQPGARNQLPYLS